MAPQAKDAARGPGRAALLAVFLAALSLRLVFWARAATQPAASLTPDSVGYLAAADGLLDRGLFLDETGALDTQRTPGYPVFLAAHRLLSRDARFSGLSQCLLDSAAAVLTASAAAALTAHPWAWTAGFLYALDPMTAAHAPLVLSDTPFSFLMILCAWLLLRAKSAPAAAAAGLALGAAALTRPVAVYLWLPWSAALWWHWGARRWAWALAFAAAAAAPTALWCARNARVFGAFEISSMSGTNLYFWEAASVLAARGEGSFRAVSDRHVALDAAAAVPGETAFDASRRRRAAAKPILLGNLATVARLHAVATVKMLAAPGLDVMTRVLWPGPPPPEAAVLPTHRVSASGTLEALARRPSLALPLLLTLATLTATYALAALAVWTAGAGGGRAAAVVLAPAAYLVVLSGWSFAYYRFRIPLLPLLAVAAAGALPRLARRRPS